MIAWYRLWCSLLWKTHPEQKGDRQQTKYNRLKYLDSQRLCKCTRCEWDEGGSDLANRCHKRHGWNVQVPWKQSSEHHYCIGKERAQKEPEEADRQERNPLNRDETEQQLKANGCGQVDHRPKANANRVRDHSK